MVMRPGYDARRRNRHQGTAARGHGSDNRLVIPTARGALPGYAVRQVGAHRAVHRDIAGKRWTFVVERTYRDSWHACSVDDLARMLSLIPAGQHEGLSLVILHQPTRKYRLLNNAWGQLSYWVDIGRYEGPAVVLHAIPTPGTWQWRAPVTPDDLREQERLREDGHQMIRRGRRLTIHVTQQTVRNTQLYRTLPHEIGHWADFLQWAGRPEGDDDTRSFGQRPTREREHAAHRYADALRGWFVRNGKIPFPQLNDRESLRADQLDPDDFIPPDSGSHG
jgi:hypothetical protein